jgi:hypothetical protein
MTESVTEVNNMIPSFFYAVEVQLYITGKPNVTDHSESFGHSLCLCNVVSRSLLFVITRSQVFVRAGSGGAGSSAVKFGKARQVSTVIK